MSSLGWRQIQELAQDYEELEGFHRLSRRPGVRQWLNQRCQELSAQLLWEVDVYARATGVPRATLLSSSSSGTSTLSTGPAGLKPVAPSAGRDSGNILATGNVTDMLHSTSLDGPTGRDGLLGSYQEPDHGGRHFHPPEPSGMGPWGSNLMDTMYVPSMPEVASAQLPPPTSSRQPVPSTLFNSTASDMSFGSGAGDPAGLRQHGYGMTTAHLGIHLPSSAEGGSIFVKLETCNWEQNAESLKIYIPLRGVQTDMIQGSFHTRSAEVTVYNLHGKNYIFTLQPTCHPIVPQACFAVASKTKKNILITLQKLHSARKDEKVWRSLKSTD